MVIVCFPNACRHLAIICAASVIVCLLPLTVRAEPWLDQVLRHHVTSNDLLYSTILIDTPAGTWEKRFVSPGAAAYLGDNVMPPERQARYRLGEIAHIFLSLAALSLEQEGKLDLNTPLSKHLAGTPFNEIKNISNAKLADLITQSAAIVDYSDHSGFYRRILTAKKDTKPWTPLGLLKLMTALEAYDDAGKGAWISKGNDMLLSMFLERDSGQSWTDLVQDHVLSPLALRNTGAGKTQPDLLPGFDDIDDAEDGKKEALHDLPLAQDIPGRDMASNATDLARLIRWLVTDKGDIAHEYRSLAARDLDGIGTGLQVGGEEDESVALFGYQPGWQAEARHDPTNDITIIVLSAGNAAPTITPALLELVKPCACLTPDLR